jgi:DNA-binding PadR family transcriptional regulator
LSQATCSPARFRAQFGTAYTECARLAKEGLLTEEQEQTGRRRRMYSLTEPGRQALEVWRGEPIGGVRELRDLGILKLFFGADPAKLAGDQLQAHEARLLKYEELHAATAGADVPRGPRCWRWKQDSDTSESTSASGRRCSTIPHTVMQSFNVLRLSSAGSDPRYLVKLWAKLH